MAAHEEKQGAIDFEDDDQDLDAAEAELMALDEGANAKKSSTVKLRVFINMDEDDEDSEGKNVDLTKLFVREDISFTPFYVDVKVADTFTCRELALESIGRFNEVLNRQRPDNRQFGVWTLDPNPERLEQNYYLYRAKKKGTAKDDPGKFTENY